MRGSSDLGTAHPLFTEAQGTSLLLRLNCVPHLLSEPSRQRGGTDLEEPLDGEGGREQGGVVPLVAVAAGGRVCETEQVSKCEC